MAKFMFFLAARGQFLKNFIKIVFLARSWGMSGPMVTLLLESLYREWIEMNSKTLGRALGPKIAKFMFFLAARGQFLRNFIKIVFQPDLGGCRDLW